MKTGVIDVVKDLTTWIASDGHGNPPRRLLCFACNTPMRRRPGNRYHCASCDTDTTIEILEVRKARK